MRLLSLGYVVVELTAIFHVAGAWAYRSPVSAELVAEEQDHHYLQPRAPSVPGSTIIPLKSIKENDGTVIAWAGFQQASGIASGKTTGVSDGAMKETAYQTWKQVERYLPDPGLISVIYVPGCGWAGGSVWYGSKASFQTYTANAPIFWNSVPGEEQGLDYKMNGKHEWHAEATATAQAELECGHLFEQGQFPENTRIVTYGKFWENQKLVTGYKPACTTGRSQVNVACEAWLDRLKIDIVDRLECK